MIDAMSPVEIGRVREAFRHVPGWMESGGGDFAVDAMPGGGWLVTILDRCRQYRAAEVDGLLEFTLVADDECDEE